MPTSAIARMASGCTRVAFVPALATSKRSPASERSSPSAIWLRAELWVHRNSTRCLFTSHLPCSLDRTSRSRAQCRPATEVVVAVTTTQHFTLARRVTAESVGTALLLAAVVGSGIMGERLAGGNVAVALLANTLATGAALVALILTLGPVRGGTLAAGRDARGCLAGGPALGWGARLRWSAGRRRLRRGGGRPRHVRGAALLRIAPRTSRRSADVQRVRGHLRAARRDLGLCPAGGAGRRVRGRRVHHRRLLVHGLHVLRESARPPAPPRHPHLPPHPPP